MREPAFHNAPAPCSSRTSLAVTPASSPLCHADVRYCTVRSAGGGVSGVSALTREESWYKSVLLPAVRSRGSAVIEARSEKPPSFNPVFKRLSFPVVAHCATARFVTVLSSPFLFWPLFSITFLFFTFFSRPPLYCHSSLRRSYLFRRFFLSFVFSFYLDFTPLCRAGTRLLLRCFCRYCHL